VAPETIFDEPLGRLFTVRSAGHVVDGAILGSLEFAAAVLRVPLLVVIAHSDCGAVGAAWRGDKAPTNLTALLEAIRPVTREAPDPDEAARRHARATIRFLSERSATLRALDERGRLRLVAGFYNVADGGFAFI